MRTGKHVARKGWNGKGMFLFLVQGHEWPFLGKESGNDFYSDFVAMKISDEKYVPWLCSQTDLLSKDWEIV